MTSQHDITTNFGAKGLGNIRRERCVNAGAFSFISLMVKSLFGYGTYRFTNRKLYTGATCENIGLFRILQKFFKILNFFKICLLIKARILIHSPE